MTPENLNFFGSGWDLFMALAGGVLLALTLWRTIMTLRKERVDAVRAELEREAEMKAATVAIDKLGSGLEVRFADVSTRIDKYEDRNREDHRKLWDSLSEMKDDVRDIAVQLGAGKGER